MPCTSLIGSMPGGVWPRGSSNFRGETVVVLGLPRGGVPVAFEVARALDAPLDVIVVRKLGVPFQPELAMGAIGEDGVRVINERGRPPGRRVRDRAGRGRGAGARRAANGGPGGSAASRPRVPLAGRTAVVVDDGIATGSTARAACQVARRTGRGPGGARRAGRAGRTGPTRIGDDADELRLPRDAGVVLARRPVLRRLLADLRRRGRRPARPRRAARCRRWPAPDRRPRTTRPSQDEEVEVRAGPVRLPRPPHRPGARDRASSCSPTAAAAAGTARATATSPPCSTRPASARCCSTCSPRTRSATGPTCSTSTCSPRRLVDVDPLAARPGPARGLPVGYFGASTGAAAALWAAAEPGADIAAVVSRGGRPDLAGPRLAAVRRTDAAHRRRRRRRRARPQPPGPGRLRCENRLAVVPGATHLFEEPGTLRAGRRPRPRLVHRPPRSAPRRAEA